MQKHKNARLTWDRRHEMVRKVVEERKPVATVAREHSISERTARKWIMRYCADGMAGLVDRTSRPRNSPRTTHRLVAIKILELRRAGGTMQAIAAAVACSVSTVSRVCSAAGLSKVREARSNDRRRVMHGTAAPDATQLDIESSDAHAHRPGNFG